MIRNQANLNALFTGFQTMFNKAFNDTEVDYLKVAMVVNSKTKQETYAWLGNSSKFREWLGARVIQNLGSHSYTIKNKPFENTIGVDKDDIDDDSYGVYSPLFAQLGQDSKQHPDELVFDLLGNGFSNNCYDGQYFFDSDHPVIDADGVEQSVSNTGGGSGTAWYLLDTSKAIKPLIFQKRKDYKFVRMDKDTDENVFSKKELQYGVDARVNAGYGLWQLAYGSKDTLNETNYAAARAAMMSFKGDHGKKINIKPNLLVVPPSLETAARKILLAERNDAGATNVYQNTAKLLVTTNL
ncbi:MAG: Mu-like prophage major head subunit gpT family protein [Alphaproteobacteria bacterium]|nr:Mu-like prophage major head subunit gpT family protein [Alphaproteobacteria bacterium]